MADAAVQVAIVSSKIAVDAMLMHHHIGRECGVYWLGSPATCGISKPPKSMKHPTKWECRASGHSFVLPASALADLGACCCCTALSGQENQATARAHTEAQKSWEQCLAEDTETCDFAFDFESVRAAAPPTISMRLESVLRVKHDGCASGLPKFEAFVSEVCQSGEGLEAWIEAEPVPSPHVTAHPVGSCCAQHTEMSEVKCLQILKQTFESSELASAASALLCKLFRQHCEKYPANTTNIDRERVSSVAKWWSRGNKTSKEPIVEHNCAHCGCWLSKSQSEHIKAATDRNGLKVDANADPPWFSDFSASCRSGLAQEWFSLDGKCTKSPAPWQHISKEGELNWRYCNACAQNRHLPRVAPKDKPCDLPAAVRAVPLSAQPKLSMANLIGN